ncbi:MAG: hypothetical protein II949_10555 [Prevotella sp.]|nr:hypothetical protein [Prevotella sp.]
MEENNNMTAERSLEIITAQIERSRITVSKDAGMSLFIAGLCIIGVAFVTVVCALLTNNMAFHLLYVLIPVLVIGIDRYVKRNKPKVPASFIGTMVNKTWQTFGIFVVTFFVLSILFNRLMLHDAMVADSIQVYFQNRVNPVRIILLMMGMAVTINGYTLKSKWMVWCGIIGGIGGFFWESFCMTETLLARSNVPLEYYGTLQVIAPNLMMAVFTFIGLTLPGWMLLKKG